LIKLIIFFIVIFSSIPIALKLFPSTQLWAEKLLNLLLEPLTEIGNAIVKYLPNLVVIGIIILIARIILQLMRYFLYEIKKHKIVEEINIYNDINIESRLDLDNEKYSIDHVLEEKITIIRTEGLFYDDLYIKNKTYKLKE